MYTRVGGTNADMCIDFMGNMRWLAPIGDVVHTCFELCSGRECKEQDNPIKYNGDSYKCAQNTCTIIALTCFSPCSPVRPVNKQSVLSCFVDASPLEAARRPS